MNMTDMMDISEKYVLINSMPVEGPYVVDVIGNQNEIIKTLEYNNSYISKIKEKGNSIEINKILNLKIEKYQTKRDQNKMLVDYLK